MQQKLSAKHTYFLSGALAFCTLLSASMPCFAARDHDSDNCYWNLVACGNARADGITLPNQFSVYGFRKSRRAITIRGGSDADDSAIAQAVLMPDDPGFARNCFAALSIDATGDTDSVELTFCFSNRKDQTTSITFNLSDARVYKNTYNDWKTFRFSAKDFPFDADKLFLHRLTFRIRGADSPPVVTVGQTFVVEADYDRRNPYYIDDFDRPVTCSSFEACPPQQRFYP